MRFWSRSSSRRPTSFLGKVGTSLFFAVFLGMGLIFTVLLGGSLLKSIKTYGWTEVPATMIQSEVIHEIERDEPFRLNVSYHYQWEGRERTSDKYSFSKPTFDNYDEAAKAVSELPTGAATVCFVNPQNPTETILRRDGLWLGLFLVIPLTFVVVGAGGIFFTWAPANARAEALSAPPTNSNPRVPTMLFGAVFALVGGALLVFWFLPTITKSLASSGWKETPCTVISSQVKSHSDNDGTTYSVDIFYRYVFNGREYRSNRYEVFSASSSGRRAKAAVVKQHPPGSATVCFVNPENPQEAVLKRGVGWSVLFGIVPIAFLLLGLWVLWIGYRGPKPLGVPSPAAMASASGGGPLTLKPGSSPLAKFGGIVAIALFWNGIVAVFLIDLLDGFARGRPDWFMAVFLTPFVAIGIGFLGAIIYFAMALTNPRCRLHLTPGVLVPGQGFEVAWEVYGSLQRMSRLSIFLEGREEATYRRGTSNYTDREVFARLPVAELSSSLEMGQGAARGHLPKSVMPTFEAANNKIVWALQVRGEIPNWPNVMEEYTVPVAPPEGSRS